MGKSRCGTSPKAEIWCNKDPCGLICAFISWFLVLYAEYVVVVRVQSPFFLDLVDQYRGLSSTRGLELQFQGYYTCFSSL